MIFLLFVYFTGFRFQKLCFASSKYFAGLALQVWLQRKGLKMAGSFPIYLKAKGIARLNFDFFAFVIGYEVILSFHLLLIFLIQKLQLYQIISKIFCLVEV